MDDTTTTKPCPECRKAGNDKSGDNLVMYPEGRGAHCFACGYHVSGHKQAADVAPPSKGFDVKRPIIGKVIALPGRRIDKRTAHLFDYRTAKIGSNLIEVANYYSHGELQAQQLRFVEKDGEPCKKFGWRGNTKKLPMFGQHLWNGKGKRIVITEGQIDCLTVSQLWGNRWPVVSIPNGSNNAAQAVRQNLSFIAGYDEIVLCFDMDDAGTKAAKECAELLPPGRVKIASLPYNDANDCVIKGESKRLLSCLYEAKSFQPDGVIPASEVGKRTKKQKTWTFPWRGLTLSMVGQRSGEITLWASGTGSGKSTVLREILYHHRQRGRRVGAAFLEESPEETMMDLIGLRLEAPVRQADASKEINEILAQEGEEPIDFGIDVSYTEEDYDEADSFFRDGPLFFYDHCGTNDFNTLMARIEYMVVALQCEVIIIDHITAVIAGMDRTGSEREMIDSVMKQFRSLVERTGVHIDIVSQLNRLDGKAAEEGGRITINNLRGSGSLGSVPNSVIAIERNQQADDPRERNIIKVRTLKGRFVGKTGVASLLEFDPDTRRLVETDWRPDESAGFEPEEEPAEDDAVPSVDELFRGGPASAA